MTDKDWKQKLKDKMAHYEEPAPEGLWESIERNLPQRAPIVTPRKRTVSLWITRITAAAACLALALLVGKDWFRNDTKEEATYSPVAAISSTDSSADTDARPVQEPATESPLPSRSDLLAVATKPVASYAESTATIEEEQPLVQAEEKEGLVPSLQKKAEESSTPSRAEQTTARRTYNNDLFTSSASVNTKNAKKESRLTANLYAMNTTSSTDMYHGPITRSSASNAGAFSWGNNANYYGMVAGGGHDQIIVDGSSKGSSNNGGAASGSNAYAGPLSDADLTKTSGENLAVNTLYMDYKSETKHHAPIRFGISLRYRLTERMAVESGVTYSLLKTDFYDGIESNYYGSTQTLHYIGIPVNVLYTVWKPKPLELYVIGGGMAERNIKRKTDTDYYLHGNIVNSMANDKVEKRLQWSLNAGAGIQANLSGKLGIYAEPVMSYYVDNHSSVMNYYKDKKLHLNLKLGLRYSVGK